MNRRKRNRRERPSRNTAEKGRKIPVSNPDRVPTPEKRKHKNIRITSDTVNEIKIAQSDIREGKSIERALGKLSDRTKDTPGLIDALRPLVQNENIATTDELLFMLKTVGFVVESGASGDTSEETVRRQRNVRQPRKRKGRQQPQPKDYDKPYEHSEEDKGWLNMEPVGNEFGSKEWQEQQEQISSFYEKGPDGRVRLNEKGLTVVLEKLKEVFIASIRGINTRTGDLDMEWAKEVTNLYPALYDLIQKMGEWREKEGYMSYSDIIDELLSRDIVSQETVREYEERQRKESAQLRQERQRRAEESAETSTTQEGEEVTEPQQERRRPRRRGRGRRRNQDNSNKLQEEIKGSEKQAVEQNEQESVNKIGNLELDKDGKTGWRFEPDGRLVEVGENEKSDIEVRIDGKNVGSFNRALLYFTAFTPDAEKIKKVLDKYKKWTAKFDDSVDTAFININLENGNPYFDPISNMVYKDSAHERRNTNTGSGSKAMSKAFDEIDGGGKKDVAQQKKEIISSIVQHTKDVSSQEGTDFLSNLQIGFF